MHLENCIIHLPHAGQKLSSVLTPGRPSSPVARSFLSARGLRLRIDFFRRRRRIFIGWREIKRPFQTAARQAEQSQKYSECLKHVFIMDCL